MAKNDRELVYSSDQPWKEQPAARSPHRRESGAPGMPQDGVIRVARENRRASSVSLVHGVPSAEVETVAKALKRHCGTGGTSKNGVIEIQGDHRDKIVAWFTAQGRKVKRAGG